MTALPGSSPTIAGVSTTENRRTTGILLLVTGVLGLLASAMLTIDKIKILEDPNFVPGCSLDPTISCGSVMQSWQGSVFGFPNPLIGIASFSVVIVAGVLTLGGVALPGGSGPASRSARPPGSHS